MKKEEDTKQCEGWKGAYHKYIAVRQNEHHEQWDVSGKVLERIFHRLVFMLDNFWIKFKEVGLALDWMLLGGGDGPMIWVSY